MLVLSVRAQHTLLEGPAMLGKAFRSGATVRFWKVLEIHMQSFMLLTWLSKVLVPHIWKGSTVEPIKNVSYLASVHTGLGGEGSYPTL